MPYPPQGVDGRIIDLESLVSSLEGRVSTLETQVANLQSRVSALEGKFPIVRYDYRRSNTYRELSSGSTDPDLSITWNFTAKPTLILAYVGWVRGTGARWFLQVGDSLYGIAQVGVQYFSGTITHLFDNITGSKLVTIKYLVDSGSVYLSEYGYYRSLIIIEFNPAT